MYGKIVNGLVRQNETETESNLKDDALKENQVSQMKTI